MKTSEVTKDVPKCESCGCLCGGRFCSKCERSAVRRTLNLLDPADRGERANTATPIVPLPKVTAHRTVFGMHTHLTMGGGALCDAEADKALASAGKICRACLAEASRINAEAR